MATLKNRALKAGVPLWAGAFASRIYATGLKPGVLERMSDGLDSERVTRMGIVSGLVHK